MPVKKAKKRAAPTTVWVDEDGLKDSRELYGTRKKAMGHLTAARCRRPSRLFRVTIVPGVVGRDFKITPITKRARR